MKPDIYVTDTGQAYGAENNPELGEACAGYYSDGQVAKLREELADCTRSHPHENMSKTCELRAEIAELNNQLAHMRHRAERAETSLGNSEKSYDRLSSAYTTLQHGAKQWEQWEQRAERAEARNAEAEKQEPGAYKIICSDGVSFLAFHKTTLTSHKNSPLYTRPIPPADVAEQTNTRLAAALIDLGAANQRIAELEQWKQEASRVFDALNLPEIGKILNVPLGSDISPNVLPAIRRIAELERKDAGYEAKFKLIQASAAGLDGLTPIGRVSKDTIWSLVREVSCEELNAVIAKAREEGRREAVPEELKDSPLYPDEHALDQMRRSAFINGWNSCRDAMLAAAPKQEVNRD